ncbi:hypothetical protein FHS16_000792 [Paenibacillus endophyticus]|uniref:Uncharacterized protein n=1 Tax=Paenibacillus endophyticus TaxID=1294268 RepID=A0A7W5G8Y3_9BACL|nr:hypothetical protein [Paenibacillus endophyticus]
MNDLRTESRWSLRTGASFDAEWTPEPMNGSRQKMKPKMFVRTLPVMEQEGLWVPDNACFLIKRTISELGWHHGPSSLAAGDFLRFFIAKK